MRALYNLDIPFANRIVKIKVFSPTLPGVTEFKRTYTEVETAKTLEQKLTASAEKKTAEAKTKYYVNRKGESIVLSDEDMSNRRMQNGEVKVLGLVSLDNSSAYTTFAPKGPTLLVGADPKNATLASAFADAIKDSGRDGLLIEFAVRNRQQLGMLRYNGDLFTLQEVGYAQELAEANDAVEAITASDYIDPEVFSELLDGMDSLPAVTEAPRSAYVDAVREFVGDN